MKTTSYSFRKLKKKNFRNNKKLWPLKSFGHQFKMSPTKPRRDSAFLLILEPSIRARTTCSFSGFKSNYILLTFLSLWNKEYWSILCNFNHFSEPVQVKTFALKASNIQNMRELKTYSTDGLL